MKELHEITDLLYGDGIQMLGAKVSQDEAVRIVRECHPYSEYCLISDWRWIDLDVTSAQLNELTSPDFS